MLVICVIMVTLNHPFTKYTISFHAVSDFRSCKQIQLRDKLTWFKIVIVLIINNIINNMEEF
jgi:hypothetical protein